MNDFEPLILTPGNFTLSGCIAPEEYCATICNFMNAERRSDVASIVQELFDSKIFILTGGTDKKTGEPKMKLAGFSKEYLKYRDRIITGICNALDIRY